MSRLCLAVLILATAQLTAATFSVADLQLELPDGWQAAQSVPPTAEAVLNGPQGQRLVIIKQIEPDGLADGAAAWLDTQAAALQELLSDSELTESTTVNAHSHQWRQLTYTFTHSEQVMHQRCWMTIRVRGGITQAWVITISAPSTTDLLDANWAQSLAFTP